MITAQEVKHTPTPWRQINGAIFDTIMWAKDQTRNTVPALFIPSPQQQSPEQNIANAAFIVKAVNAYDSHKEKMLQAANALETLQKRNDSDQKKIKALLEAGKMALSDQEKSYENVLSLETIEMLYKAIQQGESA